MVQLLDGPAIRLIGLDTIGNRMDAFSPARPGRFNDTVSTLFVLSQLQGQPSHHRPRPIKGQPAWRTQYSRCSFVFMSMFVTSYSAAASPCRASVSSNSCGRKNAHLCLRSCCVFGSFTLMQAQYTSGHFEYFISLWRNLNTFFLCLTFKRRNPRTPLAAISRVSSIVRAPDNN